MAQVKDLVCGMMINSETAPFQSEYEGGTYYFCAPGCKKAFDESPKKYLGNDDGGAEGSEGDEHHHH